MTIRVRSPDVEDLTEARQRLAHFAETTRTKPPKSLLNERGAPTAELLSYCRQEGLSLDWLFLGDINCLLSAYRARNRTFEDAEPKSVRH